MGDLVNPNALVLAAQRLGGADFASRYAGLYLLRRVPDTNPDDSLPFETMDAGLYGLDEELPHGAVAAQVALLRKREGNPYPNQIAIGRTNNCDVILRFPWMSKVHAIVRLDPDGRKLIDLGSTNGTRLNGEPLSPKTPTPLSPGDRIAFGRLQCQLVDAEQLHLYLSGNE